MLISCSSCRQQYDVGTLSPGNKVRCHCGQLMEVPESRVLEAKTLHCSSCGGTVAEGAQGCGYCGGSIGLEDRNLGEVCPECFARLHIDARYCRQCGIGIRPQLIESQAISAPCPRCETGALVSCTLPQVTYTECPQCGGLWLSETDFQDVVERHDKTPLGKVVLGKPRQGEVRSHGVNYLSCPVCSNRMNRQNFGMCSGVIIDWCKGHGYWFDTHELERILGFVREGGLDRSRKLEIRRQASELRRIEAQRSAISSAPRSTSWPSQFGAGTFGDVLGSFLSDLFS